MDFDDLDDAEEEVGVAVPEVAKAGDAAYVPYEYFPPIRRNFRLPDFDRLPKPIIDSVFGGDASKLLVARPKVCVRAFVFYGAGDTWYTWAQLAAQAPSYCEMSVHEWPSHGDAETSRGEEDACMTLDALAEDALRAVKESLEQHEAGGRIAGAPFVLIGHSIGCLLVVALAKKLRERMNLEPAAVVMLDRGAPHIPLHSERGQKYREENAWDFMRDYNGQIWKVASDASKKYPEKGEKMIKMWIDDVRLGSDCPPVGFHTFECDLLVLRASQNFKAAWLKDDATEQERLWHATRDPLMGSPPGCAADFSSEQFDEWAQWAAPGKCVVKDVDTTHMGIKTHSDTLQIIWDLLQAKKAADPPGK